MTRFCWKQLRHRTGLPCVGLNGTVVSVPHSEQVVRVSGRGAAVPEARLALHCLHRLGSFLNCLSKKNSCSPAVKTKSFPQSTHLRILSTKSIPLPSPLPEAPIATAPRQTRLTVTANLTGKDGDWPLCCDTPDVPVVVLLVLDRGPWRFRQGV